MWSLEAYEQANARLYRQGQSVPVIIHHIIAKDTVDEAIMNALRNKKKGQDALMEAVKEIVRETYEQAGKKKTGSQKERPHDFDKKF